MDLASIALVKGKCWATMFIRGLDPVVLLVVGGDVYVMGLVIISLCPDGWDLFSDELKVNSSDQEKAAILSSESIWGILRGLETFSQLLHIDQSGSALRVNSTAIKDFPRFLHRGLMLDTSRHYLPVPVIREMLDGMEMNKMNVFHWHIVDSQSFPFKSKVFPNLRNKYKTGFWFGTKIIQSRIEGDPSPMAGPSGGSYAVILQQEGGRRHTLSWGQGQANLLTPCYSSDKADGTFGPINPALDSTYTFIEKLFEEVTGLFPDKYIHLGGDEVSFDCWRSNPIITTFMSDNDIDSYADLEQYYMQRVVNITSYLNASSLVWQEVFDNGVSIPESTVVHVWTGDQESELSEVTGAGHTALLSACWYLDSLQNGGDWTKFYKCEPTQFSGTQEQKQLVIGGEACMWGEVVDESNVVARVWPRASATAEKLWSSADADTEDGASQRLESTTAA
ncbi:hypothetical protein PR048_026419 [Dryococelus australis]|uniref:beta-N-acetylhexosaminidase n=1 Tax=Dryococelus australis TaxID=614101 RepID=A0ABQ9GL98_9NEOP|nr:hypothetical protein PR048_026419 [Dryococelus australis]